MNLLLFQVRVVLLADYPLEDIFVQGDHDHDESHILMDDLGLKRVRVQLNQFFMLGVYFQS